MFFFLVNSEHSFIEKNTLSKMKSDFTIRLSMRTNPVCGTSERFSFDFCLFSQFVNQLEWRKMLTLHEK